jgi:hypothetical protein
MPAPVNVTTSTAAAVTDSGSSEKIVLTCAAVNVDTVQKTVAITGFLNLTPGTSATACVVRIRRNTVSGTQVGTTESPIEVATVSQSIPFGATDTPGESAGLVYVVTTQNTNGSGNGTVNIIQATVIVSQ